MKNLFLDEVDKNFNLKTDIALGPWCFEKKYNFFKICDLEKKNKIIKVKNSKREPLIKLREKIYNENYKQISNYLIKINNQKHNRIIYEEVSKKWLYSFIDFYIFSSQLINECIKKYGNKKLNLILNYKIIPLECKNSAEFEEKLYSKLYLTSFIVCLLKFRKPKKWKIIFLNKDISKENSQYLKGKSPIVVSKIQTLKLLVGKLKNFFFSNCLDIYGFNILQLAYLSIILRIKRPIKSKIYNKKIINKINSRIHNQVKIHKNFIEIAKKCLPNSLKNIKSFKSIFNSNGKILITSGGPLIYDDDKKTKIIFHKLNGGLIFSQQHGSNYNDTDDNINVGLELGNNGLLSWGFKKHQNYVGKVFPLPSPQLNFKKLKYNPKDVIVFCSIVNLYFNPFISGRPFKFVKERILNTFNFFKNLKKVILKKVYFKDHASGHFSEKEILKKFPIKIIDETPEKFLGRSKVMIFNNLSTMFYKSMSANQPTMAIINDYNFYTSSSIKFLKVLEKNHIIFLDPVKAAKFLNKNYDNFHKFWFSKKTQKVVKLFCENNALSSENPIKNWIRFFWNFK